MASRGNLRLHGSFVSDSITFIILVKKSISLLLLLFFLSFLSWALLSLLLFLEDAMGSPLIVVVGRLGR